MKFLRILVLILGLAVFANAQKGILSGIVTDKLGSVIPEAKFEAKNIEGKIFSTLTKDDGHYQIELPEGAYEIRINFNGFNTFTVSDYWVVNKMQLDIVLQCKKCEVIDHDFLPRNSTIIIQTTEANVSDKIQQKPLEKIPKKQNKTKRKNKNNK